jgi:hypothetical protein
MTYNLQRYLAGLVVLIMAAGCQQSVVAFPLPSTCVSGATCAPASNVCHVGAVSCDGGVSACDDLSINVPNGTDCEDAGICSSGVCTFCEAGQACTPVNSCHVGTTACTVGVQSCVDSEVPQPNGTACGTDLVCVNGACTACQEGAQCQPVNRCQVGVLQCTAASGPSCEPTQLRPAGTVCDTDAVCGMGGACTPCTAAALCTTNANQCMTGKVVCTSGEPVCVDDVNKAPGSACTGGVCNAGTCNACTQDATCASNPTECRSGNLDCTSGTPTCSDGAAKTPGTACTASGGGAGGVQRRRLYRLYAGRHLHQ